MEAGSETHFLPFAMLPPPILLFLSPSPSLKRLLILSFNFLFHILSNFDLFLEHLKKLPDPLGPS